ncbi:MAG TPA: ABC-type transport auxiliary lipoprotein family protein [Candidatus Saccharimonadales bacterium]|nr:ABC-type transport auxiliary lipoprotein family protein [Candidatus Saccharimonadales bacterium]
MPRHATTATLLVLAAVLAAGCAKPHPANLFQLVPPAAPAGAPPAKTPAGVSRIEVGVPAFEVDSPYDAARIVYRPEKDGSELAFLPDRWITPLSKSLAVFVGEDLGLVAGGFAIVGPPGGRPLDVTLAGRLMALEIAGTANGPVARCRLRLTLRRPSGETAWTDLVENEVPAASRETSDLVAAMQAAITGGLDKVRPAIVGTLLAIAQAKSRD